MKPPSADLESFSKAAAGFCAWFESSDLGPWPKKSAAAWLAHLHAAALALPERGPENDEDFPEIPHGPGSQVHKTVALFSGHYYRTVFDVDPRNTEDPVVGEVGDDMLDTYLDIKRGLHFYQQGLHEEALWHWSFMHRLHWGKHALGALTALHAEDSTREE
jgi:hypothetical protein